MARSLWSAKTPRGAGLVATVAAISGLHCAPAGTRRPVAGSTERGTESPQSPHEVLGSVNGSPIRREQVLKHVGDEMREVTNELEQRRLHLLWAGLEDAIADRLLDAEAQRRGITTKELVEAEVEAQTVEPTDEQLRAFYDEHQARIEMPFDVVASQLRARMVADRRAELWQALVEGLRVQADVRYSLPVPNLPRQTVSADRAPHKGPEDAEVTLVEFSDFQCGYCSRARGVLDELRSIYPDTLRVVFRDFPLAQHPRAREAAVAAQCAHEQDKFWAYHDLLFENSGELGDDDLRRYAKDADLSLEQFEGCMASERPHQAVELNLAEGRKSGVQGTPAFFVNGIKLVGLLPLPVMRAIIDDEIEAARKP